MSDATAYFLWKQGAQPEVAIHRPSILAVIGIAYLFGGGPAYWLRQFRIRFPFYFALASAALILVLLLKARS
jgi:hypothetical protein